MRSKKARLRANRVGPAAGPGRRPEDGQAYCTVGRAQMQAGTELGRFPWAERVLNIRFPWIDRGRLAGRGETRIRHRRKNTPTWVGSRWHTPDMSR